MSEQRVLIVSETLSLPIDEGLKKFVYSIAGPLRQRVDLRIVSTQGDHVGAGVSVVPANRMMVSSRLKHFIANFNPHAVIYVPRAAGTRNAFIRARVLRKYSPKAMQLMVSLQPRRYGLISRLVIRSLSPDIFAAQGIDVRNAVADMGVNAIAVPSGVDMESFTPVSEQEKRCLRRKYSMPESSPLVLHIGHSKRERNVLLLADLRQSLNCETVMVGSTSTFAEADVTGFLKESGVRVIDTYIERVAELYQMADCYLFPVWTSGGAIEMPLSVLEAMACGIPVVSTPFGSLPEWLPAGTGITYAKDDADLICQVGDGLRGARPEDPYAIRARVHSFSWGAIADSLLQALQMGSPQHH